MKTAAVFLTDGFEETEALTTVDILRRGGVVVTTASLTGLQEVISKNKIPVRADSMFETVKDTNFDMIILPGGTLEIANHEGLQELIKKYHSEGKLIAAICAAPAALGKAGVLAGKTAVCYPGLESHLKGANIGKNIVETDGNITTAKGPAVTPFFALKLLEILEGKAMSNEVAEGFLIPL
ncbi:MAG: DJ-1/PfpI family protein, partial [Synergistaceae bacterium]|nr:DJ-1/PfpI family protein [Synergistaceae bacterium]